MKDYISVVYENTRLKEGPVCIERFLSLLYLNHSMSSKDLATALLIPIPVVTAIKKELMKCHIVAQKNGICLTEKGKEYVETSLGYEGADLEIINRLFCDEDFRASTAEYLAQKYAFIYENRPSVDVTVDQAKGTPQTAFKRAILCLTSGSLIGKKVLCVGDDDLVSIALGLLLKHLNCTSPRAEICVFDIDPRFIAYIEGLASFMVLPITCCKIDLRDPLPINYANHFDSFFTDPPYTLGGLSLFISRGISALKKKSGMHVFFSFGNKSLSETMAMQKLFGQMGLIISEMHRDFNEYEGASLYGGVSQMIVLQTTDSLSPIIEESFNEDLYTFDFRNAQHTYVCRQCGHSVLLKKGETIENLKKVGCTLCGGHIFDQKGNVHKDIVVHSKKSLGTHILVDFYGCNPDILNDVNAIRHALFEAAEVAKASIVADNFHMFSPFGVSGALIIKESHFTIHTWPEHQYAAVDLFTCGSNLDLKNAMFLLKERFESANMEFNNIMRGILKNGKAVHS